MSEGYGGNTKKTMMKMMAGVLSKPFLFQWSGRIARWFIRIIPGLAGNRMNPWYKGREMPDAPKQSFSEWYKNNRK